MRAPFLLCLCIGGLLHAQSPQNALAFDKIDDYASAANASALVAGKTGFALTAWVFPTNTNPGWPAFDGIVGIRNDANADFYMLQLSATQYEARFRNSGGTAYTITSASVSLNEWQHLALVYDGTTLKFYKNGALQGSASASGTINAATLALNMGRLPFNTSTTFFFSGRLDEVALWGAALTQSEITCLTNKNIDPNDPQLLLYYPFNVGVAGGPNTGITQLAAAKGGIPATIHNMSMTGTNSNLVAGVGSWGYQTASVCNGASFQLGGQTFSNPGTYLVAVPTNTGCDSVVELVLGADSVTFTTTSTPALCFGQASGSATAIPSGAGPFSFSWNCVPPQTSATATGLRAGTYQCTVSNANGCSSTQSVVVGEPINGLNPLVTWSNGSLTATHSGTSSAQFQWVSCPNFTPLANQTNPAFSPIQNGTYAVIVTDGPCSDTSDCVVVANVGHAEFGTSGVRIWPNPARTRISIALSQPQQRFEVVNLHGQKVAQGHVASDGTASLSIDKLPNGVYWVRGEFGESGYFNIVH